MKRRPFLLIVVAAGAMSSPVGHALQGVPTGTV